MRWTACAALALAAVASPAMAGPPYLTDDPAPTDTGHWEVYGFATAEGRKSALDADAGFDLNYGIVKDVQLTATLPLGLTHDSADGWKAGTGDAELGVKYRLLHDETHGISAAIFPRIILPTSSLADHGTVEVLLPVWAQKDFKGGTSIFGGGGYQVNRGRGNRDFWLAALAITQNVSDTVSVGAETAWQGADTIDGTAQIRAGLGSTIKLSDHYALLGSAGPTWADHRTGYHAYVALGLFF